MSNFEIREFTLPGNADEEWVAYRRMNTDDSVEVFGPRGPRNSLEASLRAVHAALTKNRMRRWLAWVKDRPVGFTRLVVDPVDEPEGTMTHVYVRPGYRWQGIGQALAEVVQLALEPGTRYVNPGVPTSVPGLGNEALPSSVGEEALLASNPWARLALRYGFVLRRAMRYSRYKFTAPAVALSDVLAAAGAATEPDHEVYCLEGKAFPG